MRKTRITGLLRENKKLIIKAIFLLAVVLIFIISCNVNLSISKNLISLLRIGSGIVLFYSLLSFKKEE